MQQMNRSPFSQASSSRVEIADSIQVIFVSDMFVDDYVGGAELTTEALITSSPVSVMRVRSRDVDLDLLERGHRKFWVFGNFAQLDKKLIPTVIANLTYSVLEYDYKFCKYRSPEKHLAAEDRSCDCHESWDGKLVSAFFHGARSVWWMSERQKALYVDVFPTLAGIKSTVLSSVFDDATFAAVARLREEAASRRDDRHGWIVLGSTSWIKGQSAAIERCEAEGWDYEVVWNVPYAEMLRKLSRAQGLVYLPAGRDTCPRMVIEAKLLGCQLVINENVEHAQEEWFATDDTLVTESYLYAARSVFWNGVLADMDDRATISGYTTTYNCISQGYPFRESITSMLAFCDEVVVVDGGSSDGTLAELNRMAASDDRIIVHVERRDWSSRRFAVYDGRQKALARSMCSGHFCWQQDSDEIVDAPDAQKIRNIALNFPTDVDLIALPVVEYWGPTASKVRMDATPWKWRMSRNSPHITHGIPARLRRYDDAGELYSAPGSDGCDYVRSDTFEPVPFASFMSADAEHARQHVLATRDLQVHSQYESWFWSVVAALPSVRHYSWFDIGRKIRTYRDYWSKHWLSLYNAVTDDSAANNMFFGRPWSCVTEADIDDLAVRLAAETGGWIFHRMLDLSVPTPHMTCPVGHPALMSDWISQRGRAE